MQPIHHGWTSSCKVHSGLKYLIQECMILHDVFSVDEAHNKAIKIERLQNRTLPLKSAAERASSSTRTQPSSTLGEWPQACEATDTFAANLATSAPPTTKGKENPYVKSGVGKRYRWGEPRHKSNECSKRHQVNIADYEEEDEVEIETEPALSRSMERRPPTWYNGCYATKRSPTIHNDIKSSTRDVR